jgi:hypothetical protein
MYQRKLANPELLDRSPIIHAWPVGVLVAVPAGGERSAGQLDWAANWEYLLSVARLLKGREGFHNLRIVSYYTCPLAMEADKGPYCNLDWGGRINGEMSHTELGRAFGYKEEVIRRHNERVGQE